MFDRRKLKVVIKLLILLLSLILMIKVIRITLSKYETISTSTANIDVAFYVVREDYQTMTLNLGTILPQDNPYVYTFSVSNKDQNNNIAETNIEYDLQIKTTTNLPQTYELYMNESYTNENSTNIITSNEIVADTDGTYFRTINTNTENFVFTEAKTNVYQLVVYLPSIYNSINYQDIIENIEISISSRQVINNP